MKQHTTRLLEKCRKFMRRFAAGSRRSSRRNPGLAIESLETRELLAAAFLAPAMPAGNVNVQLDPLANVTAGVPEVVTFGVPFTRGSVSESQLSQIRVLKNGVEIPAFVQELTPWRSIDDPGIDGQSVRVARIQIAYTFTSLNPETITVQWGGPARTLSRTTLQDPRIEWHTVTSGSFVAADNVQEPDVLPVLPAAYLALGMLDSQTIPTNSAVPETRDNPAVMDSTTFTGFQEFDSAEKNFFYTIINQNGTTPIDYKTQAEPWLYDRSSSMFQLYLRSGFATALREAIRSTDFYVNHLDSSGFFTLKPGDPKYSYNESLAYTYWLLGDNRMLAPISTVVSAFDGTQTHWTPDLSFFTERNTGDKLLANDIAYEVTGNATYKANVQTIVGDFIYLQNGANGQLPSNRIDGGLYHFGFQHDITEVSSGDVIIASSWMSALVVDPMVRVFGIWQDNANIPDFIIRMGNFEKAASKTDANGQFGGVTRYPDYLMRTDGTSDSRSDTDVQHAMDVGAVAAWATYFAELRGTPDASLRQLATDLYATYDLGVNVWTSTSDGFRVTPPRRYNWEYKNSASFSWALTATDAPNQAGTLSFSAGNSIVVENQGVATVTVTRTNGSTGSVSVNYATSNGTATAGSDYTATSGTLTFADGETSKTFTVPIINDSAVENAETVTLTLSNPTGGASLNTPATATLTINSDDTTNQPITTTLQQGVNGYTGTTDADISTQYADSTGGNGSTTTDGNQLGVYQLTGTGAYSIEGLIRFGNLGITSNDVTHATVTSATLTLTVDTFDAATLRGYYLLAPWTTASGSNLGWIHRGTGQDWATPGALGQGTDVVAGKSFVLSGITPTGAQTITVNLDPTVVQSWIDNPSANQGIVLVNETTGAVVRVDASENATAGLRPKLSISYTVGSATTTPQPGSLQFTNPTYNVNENGGTATVTVTRTGGSTGSVSVDFATSNGTATAGSDYTASSGALTFADGETSKTFTIPISDDTLVEGDETVSLTLSNPTGGATLGSQATATLTIADDDVVQPGGLQFSRATYTVNETQATATITVTRTGGSNGSVSINYATSNGTATAGSDYTASSGTLTFADGETSKTFTIPISNDTLVEGDETVNLTLSSPTGGATLGTQGTATLTIVSDDVAQPGVLQFSGASYTVNETQGTATITVTRTGGSNVAVSVNYATSNGTATAGSDYTAASGTLTFGVGETSKTFTIPITNDTLVEGNETVNLALSSPTGGATLGAQAAATLTIVSDDVAQPGVLQFSTATYTVNEAQGTATITVTRTGGSNVPVSIHYATSNGTATAGSDYTAASGTLTFAAGETSKTFTVPIINDTLVEGNETVNLTLSNPTGGATLGTLATAVLTIVSDDTNGQPTTVTLRQGVNGYTGTTDVSITTQNAQFTAGNGLTTFTGGQMGDYQTTGTGSYIVEDLIRFSNLGIPASAAVTGVTLTLSVENWVGSPTIRGYYVLAPWSGTPGPNTSQLGWLHRGNGQDWNTPGALGQGTDVIAGNNFVLPGITPTGTQTITIHLDPAVVQSWINNPSSNQGILLVNETPGAIVRINTSENSKASFRPQLSVTYTTGTGTPQPGTLQLSNPTYSVNENGGTATITVTRTGGSDGTVSVNFATSNGTATAGSDYTTSGGTLTFAPGETSKTFTIPILNDAAVEGSETVNLVLSSPTGGATLGTQSTAVLTIVDDDVAQPGVLQFSTTAFTINENQGTATITVTRTGGSNVPVSVNFTTSNGTATAGSDYTATSGTLNFAVGETSKTFTIPITNDTLVEGDETVNLTLSSPTSGATLGSPNTAVLTIVDDEVPQPGVLQFSTPVFTVNENQGTATITVTRTGGSNVPVTVNFTTSNGTATAGSDYTAVSGTLTFAAGETSKTFTISISNDTLVEGDETVNLTLSSPTGGATLGTQSTATLTIVDDDVAEPGTVQFNTPLFTFNETQGTATITVTRTGNANVPVSVNFATSDGTATAGSDYTAVSGTLTFAVGETSKTFTIPITNDTLVEGDETVNLTLSSPTGGATLGTQSTAVLTIQDDDVAQPGVLQFSTATYTVNETQGTATITITRAGGSNVPVSVNFATSNGTATAGSDYTAVSGTLTFAVGETSKTFTIPIANDTLVEGDETVNLTLSSPTGGATLGNQTTAVLTIVDDDTNTPTTVTLQQGINGYTGTTDASITTQNAQFTSGNGLTDFTSPQMGDYQTTDANSYMVEDLIRFSDLGIPTNATVSSVTLTLSLENFAGTPTIRGYYVLAPWSSTPGPDASQLGWLHRGTGQDWNTPGALGQGTDVIAGNNFVLPGITAVGTQTITINLDPAVVQSWINNPSSNQGILLVNETAGAIVRINTSENATAAFRPKLSVTYTPGTGTPQPGTLQLSNPTYSVNENGGTATITVTRTGGSDGSVSVNFATSNGTATAGSDYTASSGTLTFAPGETSKTFTVPITNDTLVEGNETVNLTLSSPTGGATLGSQSTAVLTIQDDEVAGQAGSLQFNASSYSLMENGGALTVTVTRTGGSSGAVSVNFATSDGTATAGSDYAATSGTLTFADGETSKTFTITVLDDSAVESDETVTLTLSNPTGGATLGSPALATFTILDNDSTPGVALPTGFTQTTIATGLDSLTAMTAAPDGRLFVLEQSGNVRVVKNGALLPTPAFTVTTIAEQERGLIGITLDPNFTTNHFVYVEYTVGGPTPNPAHNRISRFTLNGDVAVPGSEMILLELPQPTNRIHNGGGMKFGVDGKLYIAVGNDNVFGNSQDLTNPFGKILRINADGSIPTDNPFFNQPGAYKAIWAYGLRNPYTLDVQPGTGLMYINDVGEASFEEIDQGIAGANYGWPNSEGYTTDPQFTSPVYAYSHGTGANQGFAIVGGAFYNPATPTFPSQYVGKYFFADFVNGWISFVSPGDPNPKTATTFATGLPVRFDGGPVDLEVGADGALYYLDRFGGGVFKIQFTATPPSITQQPATQTVTQGQSVTFTVTASSSLPLTYQWQKMDSGTTTFVNIAGATSPSFTLTNPTAADNGDQFRCVVSNSAGSTNSSAATLTVTAPTTAPTVGAHTLAFVPFNSPAGSLSTNPLSTQLSGSTILAWLGRGNLGSFTPATVPTDNLGNTAIQLDSTHTFAPLFPNSGMALYTFPSFAGGNGDVFTAPMPVNDEVTLMVVEIKNGGLIQDFKWNQVSSGPQTSLSVTTTGPATLVSFWTGDSPSGLVSATPDNGFTLLDIQPASTNSVQAAVATKDVSAPGTYNVTWTANPAQTGYIWLVAVQHAAPPPQPGTLQLSTSNASVNEGQGTATVTVTRTGGSDGGVSVHYATSNGTATAGSDYTAVSGTLTFAAGETSKTFTVPITNDTAVEGNETVNITLSNPTGGATLGTPASGTLTIVDDDTAPTGAFTNVTVASGIDAIINQQYQQDPNWWLSGEHLVDLDNDGHLDLFLDAHTGGAIAALNDGHGHFTRVTGSFPDSEIHEMFDINGDGKVDLNATFSDGGSQWWINHSTPGHVNFTPTTVTRDGNTSRSQVLFDFNGDGKVDWFRSAEPGLVVDFGDGNGGFTQGSLSFPIAGTDSNDNASFLPADFDGDGKIDLLVLVGGNYDGTPGKTLYWHNNGNMTFTDVTASSGIPANGTIAKGIGDFNQDGHTDFIAIANKSMPPVIYLNDGHGHFTVKANAISGMAPGSLDYTSWGTAVTTDIDNDGVADIVMDGKYYLKVLRGTGGGNFTYMNTPWGITDTAAASLDDGLCFGDIDGDGRLDMIGYDETFPIRTLTVYHNDLTPQNYLNVRVVGLAGNVGAAGATISIFAAGTNRLLWDEQVAQYDFQVATSYYAYDQTERHFGLGGVANVDVVVQFASGKTTRINNVSANQTIQVLESAGS